ncbi:carbohydrate esterase family 1 protein, partial [Xylaria sp. FL1042]
MGFETKATIANFGGKLLKLTHQSTSTQTPMNVSVYLPPAALSPSSKPVPVLFFLSGLTCTPDNCSEKGFLQASASKHGIAIVYPDTSPRGANIPGEDDAYDFGSGAGFYVDATQPPWNANYNMYSYITSELPSLLFSSSRDTFSGAAAEILLSGKLDGSRVSLTGHSMGGHGALTLYLKNPGKYRSVSAFAPISNPSACPWGEKAFGGYLGGSSAEEREGWKAHDATHLVGTEAWKGRDLKALIDVGTGDQFYKQGQLLPENFERAVKEAGVTGVTVRYQEVS